MKFIQTKGMTWVDIISKKDSSYIRDMRYFNVSKLLKQGKVLYDESDKLVLETEKGVYIFNSKGFLEK